ncbi:MFS transporter [Virgisporangium aurantiacum]|uniref:MFS transporter n=1 Tax=Virgisporangium aurantiacum TaxID=175570 RepID=A0A8J3Z6G5_9ACTN|nr:MFS transporter [Virgisporangium aurantiacum]GIJ58289.1 MFS transporter [Virgisporangium aurantiacum]
MQRTLVLAAAGGVAVASVYYAPPLLDVLAADFDLPRATVGTVVTATQVGYGLGLALVVPLGDRLDRRRLIVGQFALSAVALAAVGVAPSARWLLGALAVTGVLAVVTQVLVAHAAGLAEPADRGAAVGTVTGGIVLGILLARVVAGTLADVAGWRAVYLTAAALALVMAELLRRTLPRRPQQRVWLSYPGLLRSTARLFVEVPVLRVRAVLALLTFAAMTVLLTPMALPLSAPPYALSTTAIGLFGLAGAAGALGATRAGRLADRGKARRVTTIGLVVMLAAWLPAVLLPWSLWGLVIGVVAFDFGLQSVHVTNQNVVHRADHRAPSRLTAVYMIFYSIGSAAGAAASTTMYAAAGWRGVCALGAGISLVALAFFLVTERITDRRNRHDALPHGPHPRRRRLLPRGR